MRTTDAERAKKCRRGTRSDLTPIVEALPEIQEELYEQGRLLEILTVCQTADGAQQGEQGSRR